MNSAISLKFTTAFDKSDKTGDMERDSLESRVVGLLHYVDFDNFDKYSIEGGYVKAEPDNVHDSNAIAVYHDSGKQIGYIPRWGTAPVKEFMDDEEAPCIICIIPYIDQFGEKGLTGFVRIFKYFDGEDDYVTAMLNHFFDYYASKLNDALTAVEEKLDELMPDDDKSLVNKDTTDDDEEEDDFDDDDDDDEFGDDDEYDEDVEYDEDWDEDEDDDEYDDDDDYGENRDDDDSDDDGTAFLLWMLMNNNK